MHFKKSLVLSQEEFIFHFLLQDVLPEKHEIVVNTLIGTFSILTSVKDSPRMWMQQRAATSEIQILLSLLQAHPYYCPHEVIFAAFTTGNVADAQVKKCRAELQEAQKLGTWKEKMDPVRGVLSRLRLKLRELGIEVSSILETGYILVQRPARFQKQKEEE